MSNNVAASAEMTRIKNVWVSMISDLRRDLSMDEIREKYASELPKDTFNYTINNRDYFTNPNYSSSKLENLIDATSILLKYSTADLSNIDEFYPPLD